MTKQRLQEGTRMIPGTLHVPEDCRAISEVLARVGDKWTVLVVSELGRGPKRFNEIRRALGSISQRMLTLTLRGLERDGLVTRTVFPTIPPRVDYELTRLGRSLLEPVSGIGLWARQNRAAIQDARTRFDTATEGKSRLSRACLLCRSRSLNWQPMTYVEAAAAPLRKTGQIKLHGKDAFEGMRKAGRLVPECLDMLTEHGKPGVSTDKLDRLVAEFGFDHGALPATLMYRGYKKASCTSINHVVCHGIPGDKPLKEGDIVNVDVTLILNGWHGDSSRMFAIGDIPRRAERLMDVTHEAMMRGIAAIRPGATSGDIGHAIQTYVEAQHMSVVRDFCGHGLGRLFHDEPNIVHVGRPGEGIVLKPGMFFTVEPMINLGRPHVKVLSDGWTAVTRDRSLSAQFEHTVAVTPTGVEVFTFSPAGLHKPPYKR